MRRFNIFKYQCGTLSEASIDDKEKRQGLRRRLKKIFRNKKTVALVLHKVNLLD